MTPIMGAATALVEASIATAKVAGFHLCGRRLEKGRQFDVHPHGLRLRTGDAEGGVDGPWLWCCGDGRRREKLSLCGHGIPDIRITYLIIVILFA